jgi:hypothetical protein
MTMVLYRPEYTFSLPPSRAAPSHRSDAATNQAPPNQKVRQEGRLALAPREKAAL